MHNNCFFLRQLTPALKRILQSSVISECFSQNKDELMIRFERKEEPFFIRASLSPSFSCLSFPENFQRARRNSIDLFESLIGQHVEGIRQFENERSFTIELSNNFSLLFKMHGNRANVLLFKNNAIEAIFRNNIEADLSLNLNNLDRQIDWSFEHFVNHHSHPESIYFTFGKLVWKYLKDRQYKTLLPQQQWDSIQEVLQLLNHPTYYIVETEGAIHFCLLKIGNIIREFNDPVKGIHEFFSFYAQQDAFTKEKTSAVALLKSKLHATENYLEKTFNKLREIEGDNNYKIWADLIMANLNSIHIGMDQITLPDFYHENRPTEIKLKKDLSPQKTASIFYKKSKNQQIEVKHIQQLINAKQKEQKELTTQLADIESATDLKTLRRQIGNLNLVDKKEKQSAPLPYREVEFNGYKIWIGKNAQSNDTLTLKYGHKDDLWLHAKDVTGSHVLLKYQSGKKFPKEAIERAAQLAAYYSKRKNESLCPVAITPRKFVRKRKGDPAGAVVVDREEVMMVEPLK